MVKKEYLVLIAALVWTAAGANILRLGIAASLVVQWEWWMYLSAVAVFVLFGGMFGAIVSKHTRRIYGYDGARKHLFLKFFDVKAYILMIGMMAMGILLRGMGWIPDRCTAMFYTGLGGALTCAGIAFAVIFIGNIVQRKKIKMQPTIFDRYIAILQEELRPAMGCTEPISVAYASATAREMLGEMPQEAVVAVSGNILKNVKSVVVPHTGGMRGIDAAVCAGIVAGAADKQLEVISAVTDEQIAQIKQLRETLPVRVELADTQHIFDVCVTLRSRGHTASVRIVDYHTNIVRKELDGRSLFEKAAPAATGAERAGEERTDRSCLSVEQIYRFVSEVPLERLRPVLVRQAEYNMAIAEEGLRNPYGANIGKVLLKHADATGDVRLKARAYAAAGSDARMNGCEMPVVIVSGSGNQGLTASVPVIVYARELGKSEEEMYRALALSDLITIHQKTGIGTLSAYCGAVSAGVGAGAGIAYLYGGGLKEIAHTVVNAVAIVSGMICDGAKASCAAKISQAVDAGILGYEMFREGNQFYGGDGIVTKGVENTIRNIGRLAHDGMAQTDKEIIDIMLHTRDN